MGIITLVNIHNYMGDSKMKKIIFLLSPLVLLAGLALMQCQSPFEPDGADYGVLARALTPEEIELAASADRFGLKLFREVVRQDADKNIFISPLSVSMALGMTANGAANSTLPCEPHWS